MLYFPLIRHGPHRKRKNLRDTMRHRQQGDVRGVILFFFQNKESRPTRYVLRLSQLLLLQVQ
jgi:hypothetical protein